MKKRWITWVLIVVVLIMTVGGTTLAWFTATAPVQENTFTAGTVEIEAGGEGTGQIIDGNWNPGDTDDFDWEIINKGTKAVYIRAKLDMNWLPNQYRLLVLYTGESVQLLAIEWDQNITIPSIDGPIATGDLKVRHPVSTAYMIGTFGSLSNVDILKNGTEYNVWCIDHWTSINRDTWYDVQIFDPISNPDWYSGLDVQQYWKNIPMSKIAFIINQNYLAEGYTVDDIQNAIWHFTNGDDVSGKAKEIVDKANAGYDLPSDNVIFTLLGENWIYKNGYYYYKDVVPGSYTQADETLRTIIFDARLKLDGDKTDDKYQGRSFVITVKFEAIQSSNKAVNDAWPDHPYNLPA